MVSLMLAAGGFLFASRRISMQNYCASNQDCTGCGLKRVCKPAEENKSKSDEKE